MRKRSGKKFLSTAMAVIMALSMTPIQAAADVETKTPLIQFTFDEDVTDGSGAYGKVTGTLEPTTDEGRTSNVLTLTRGNYLKVLDDADAGSLTNLIDKEALTVTWWEKNSSDSEENWVFWAQGEEFENKLAVRSVATAERLQVATRNGGNINAEGLTSNEWRHLAVVVTETGVQFYVNGTEAATATAEEIEAKAQNGSNFKYSVESLIGTYGTTFYIGYSGWNQGADLKLDDFRVYGDALTDTDIQELYSTTQEIPEETDEPGVPIEETALEKVNGAEDATALKEIIEANAEELEIDLDTYNELTDDQKAEVIVVILENRPKNGYADNDAVKAAFDTAVEAQTTVIPEPTVTVQETTATEDEDTKTIIYAPTTLNKMTKVNAQVVEDTEDDCDVMELSAWTSWGNNYGVCHVILTEDNASNLISVTANAKVNYGGTHFGMIVYTPSTGTDTDEDGNETTTDTTVITRTSQHWVSLQEWQEYNLLSQSYDAKTASLYFGLSNCQAGIWVKNVTAVYQKSDIDKALDAAIAAAEAIENPNDDLTAALNTAKQYKISTTTDIETAILANQTEIATAVNALAEEVKNAGGEGVTPVEPVVPEYKLGDVNSDDAIDLTDALYALQIALNIVKVDANSSEYLAANVVADENNIVDINDVLAILKKANGKKVEGLEWYTAE